MAMRLMYTVTVREPRNSAREVTFERVSHDDLDKFFWLADNFGVCVRIFADRVKEDGEE